MSTNLLLAADQHVSAFLLSFYKPLLMLAVFIPWAWLVSSKLDKDARFYYLNHRMWNGIHMGCGAAAAIVMLIGPTAWWFWVGWPVGVLILLTPVLVYWQIRNKSVPENARFTLSSESLSGRMQSRRLQRAARAATITYIDSEGNARDVPSKDDPLNEIHILSEDLFGPALAARASRLEMSIARDGVQIMQTIDGLTYRRKPNPPIMPELGAKLVDYLKDIAGLDVEDRRRRQVNNFSLHTETGTIEITMVTAGSSKGQLVRFDFDRAKRLSIGFDNLGLLEDQIAALRTLEAQHERHGVVLLGAPKGQGLSTTGYAFLGRHDAYTSNIKTLELEVMLELDGVDHVQWDPNNPDVDYATNLQSILRRDPDVVLAADARDADSARVASAPGRQGPLIYILQPLPTIQDQLREWIQRVGDVKEVSRSLRAVVNQRLLRTLCQNCRQPYRPSPEQLAKLKLPADKVKQLYQASGKVQVKNKIESCPVCNGTGYFGQTAAFQVFMVDDESARLLGRSDLNGALTHARREKMLYLQEAALRKVIAGETTIEEVIRVTAPPKSQSERKPTPQPNPAGTA